MSRTMHAYDPRIFLSLEHMVINDRCVTESPTLFAAAGLALEAGQVFVNGYLEGGDTIPLWRCQGKRHRPEKWIARAGQLHRTQGHYSEPLMITATQD